MLVGVVFGLCVSVALLAGVALVGACLAYLLERQ
jgi:hypothetical protein